MQYFDAHCHIQFDAYADDRDAVLARMKEAGVGGLVVGCDAPSSQQAVELVQGNDSLYAAVGLHPNEAQGSFDFTLYDQLAAQEKVRAIGECGLDYYRPEDANDAVKARQREVFEQHIEIATRHDLPLMIHSRPSKGSQDAYWDTVDLIRSAKRTYGDKIRGNMHFFVGGTEEAKAFVELGFSVSYTAVITFAREYDDVIKYVPLTSLLSETDSPFVAPAPNRGKRNEPTAVQAVVAQIAQIRGEQEDQVRETLLQNARQKFAF